VSTANAAAASALAPALAVAGDNHRAVPAHARQLAARLSALFERDVELVKRLNDTHHRLATANEQLYTRLTPDTLAHLHWQIHHAFCAYQATSEQRRQLAVDVGELSNQLTQALCAAGWSAPQARQANVHQLARASA